MIQSTLILNILDLTFDGYEYAELLRKQIPFLTEGEKEYTGTGLFIDFIAEEGIYKYRITGNDNERINGVEIRNEELNILADADVCLKNGIIEYIEIWNKLDVYPSIEPEHYELHQAWLAPEKRRIIVR